MIKIRIYGLGGQGVVTLGKVLCTAYSIYEGQFAKTMPSYGHERKGGAVLTDVIADNDRIHTNSFITNPDYVVVLETNANAEVLKLNLDNIGNATLLLNTDVVKQDYASLFSSCFYADATLYSLNELGKNLPNIGMIGALAKVGAISLDAVTSAVSDFFGENADPYNRIIMEAYNDTKER